MIKQLSVSNYALIEAVEVDFDNGLTVITGETGAGKSILLGALALMLGQRADTQVLRDKNKKCVVEGVFDISNYKLQDFFSINELDFEKITNVRREINAEGKSRAFINDTPVNLSVLKELSTLLVDIHSQHETLTLNDSKFQLSVVDAIAQTRELLNNYKSEFKILKNTEREFSELVEKEKEAKKNLDYYQFQYNELEEAALKINEQEELEQELEMLANSEEIKRVLSGSFHALNGDEKNILSALASVKTSLSSITRFNSSIQQLSDRLNSAYIELKDIAQDLENIEEDIKHDPKRTEQVNERRDVIYHLQNKHNVKTVAELLEIKNSVSLKLNEFQSMETQIRDLQKKITELRKQLMALAKKISAARQQVIPGIEKEIKKKLSDLAMPNAQVKIEQTIENELNENGIDKIKFLFSANKGNDLSELNKVASGGELSRLMLTIKSLIAKHTSLPTVIFDEIDTGVSGDVAHKIGNTMNEMAKSMQVITITHLPQIASKGSNHYFVFKEDGKSSTSTGIYKLNSVDRIKEIAKMLSTGKPTEAAIKNAEELLRVK